MNGAKDLIAIAIVRKAHGTRGQCAVSGFGETMFHLTAPITLLMGKDPESAKPVKVTDLKDNPKGFLCKFDGYDDMDSAETLRDFYLFCDTTMLPKLNNGKHYSFELEGLTVVEQNTQKVFGVVTNVVNYPTVDCLEVRKEDGTVFSVAMTPDAILSIDKAKGAIIVAGSALEDA